MKYLLDTCTALAAMSSAVTFDKKIKDIILDKRNQIYYSTISMWEVEIKHQKNKRFYIIWM